jgi:hypothetical protein
MISFVLVTSVLLVGQTATAPKVKNTEKPATKAAPRMDPAEALAKYNELREQTPATAAAQWKLGLWCEQHGLKAEAYVHFAEVVRQDPKREAAWRKLGFKKFGRRWTTDEQIVEDNEQKKADKVWGPRLRQVHKDIHGAHGTKKRHEAQAGLDAISDPRAIPSIYREFGVGGPSHQTLAIQILGQINKPLSSKVLAMLAVYGKSPEVRRRATETLRDRSPEDFLDLLVGLMIDPLKYEVRPVGGPGSPGVLFVEGERFNVSRFYAPPPPPNFTPGPGDIVTYDAFGMPVITHSLATLGSPKKIPGLPGLAEQREISVQFSARQMMIEAQQGAVAAQAQLEGDVTLIKSINDVRARFNDLVIAVLKFVTGKDRGRTPKEWRDALAANNQYDKKPSPKPTLTELVPLAYNPTFGPLQFVTDTRLAPDH